MALFSGHSMRIVAFSEVLHYFDEEHPVKPDNTNEFARGLLSQADKKFGGAWACVSIEKADILNIMLPHHLSEGGRIALVPRTGLTVLAATKKLQEVSIDDYKSASSTCWGKIAYWGARELSPVFLSVAPVDHDDYNGLIDYRGHLIHLDGLHRLIAWSLSRCGVHNPESDRQKADRVLAYVAGYRDCLTFQSDGSAQG